MKWNPLENSFLIGQLDICIVNIRIVKGCFEVRYFISPTLKFYWKNSQKTSRQLSLYEQWKINNWCCKPTKMIVDSLYIKGGSSIFEKINNINSIVEIKLYHQYELFYDDSLFYLLKYLKNHQEWKVFWNKEICTLYHPSPTQFLLNTNSFTIVWNNEVFPAKLNIEYLTICGCIKGRIHINGNECIAMEIQSIMIEDPFSIQYDPSNMVLKYNYEKRLRKLTAESFPYFFVVKTEEIIQINRWNTSYFNIFSKINTLENAIEINDWEENEEKFINNLKMIPRFMKLEWNIKFKNNFPYIKNEFWKIILEFKSVEIKWNLKEPIIIKKCEEVVDIDHFYNNKVNIRIGRTSEKITFQELQQKLNSK